MKSYNDPAKKLSRDKQREFISDKLKFLKPDEINVVCFPGAEVTGEEAIEIKEIYDSLNIPRKNITGLEFDPEKAQRLRDANLGINVVENMDLDFFKNTTDKFHVISLDYTGYRDENKWESLHQIAGRQLLFGNGILCTNYSTGRESQKYQNQMLALQSDSILLNNESKTQFDEKLQNMLNGENLNLPELRDNLSARSLMIMRMGTSALRAIAFLKKDPLYQEVQEVLIDLEKELKDKNKFLRQNKYDVDELVTASHELSYGYRTHHMASLASIIDQKNNYLWGENGKVLSLFIVGYFIDTEINAQFPRSIERYQYTSNKGTKMQLDLIAFNSAQRIYRHLNGKIHMDELGNLQFQDLNLRKLINYGKIISPQISNPDIPERILLNSSKKEINYTPKIRIPDSSIETMVDESNNKDIISKRDAIELLQDGCSPGEISDCFDTFSKGQLAAFKAHYVTMGKEYSDKI